VILEVELGSEQGKEWRSSEEKPMASMGSPAEMKTMHGNIVGGIEQQPRQRMEERRERTIRYIVNRELRIKGINARR
jgi:hypothetical protein